MEHRTDQIRRKFTRAYISQHFESWHPRFFENYDINTYLETLDSSNADVLLVTARSHNGYWYTDVGMGRMHPGLHGVDQVAAALGHLRGKGKLVMAYFSAVYDKEMYDDHPSWRQVDKEGRPIKEGSFSKIVCVNSPYREYAQLMLKRLFEVHDLDGVLVDMAHFEDEVCYCPGCRAKFRSLHGAELPVVEDWDNPLYRKVVEFRRATIEQFVRELQAVVKNIRPAAMVYFQYVLLKPTHFRNTQTVAMGRDTDYVYSDMFLPGGLLPARVIPKTLSGIARNPPEVGIMCRPGTHSDTPNMMTLDHMRYEAFSIIANGGAVHFFDIMWPDGSLHAANWARIGQVASEVQEREPWLGAEPAADVAVLLSEKSQLWYGRDEALDRVSVPFFGACRALYEENIAFEIIHSITEERLGNYRVLVLPNVASMSEEEAEVVRAFVRAGGGLVCTGATSLYDEEGFRLADYRLSDVLGLSWRGDTATYSRVFGRYATNDVPAQRLPEGGWVTSWGAVQRVEAVGGSPVGELYYPYTEPTGDDFVNIMANPPATRSEWPACVANTFGEGRAVYFADRLDANYLTHSFPELKWLLADAVRHVADSLLSVEVLEGGPLSINIYHRREEKEILVHLASQLTECTSGISYPKRIEVGDESTVIQNALQTRDLIAKIYPVRDIRLRVAVPTTPKKVTLQPENRAAEWTEGTDGIEVSVEQVEFHTIVVIEY